MHRAFSGLDFNNIEKSGMYSDGSTPTTSGCKNYPVDVTGMLVVFKTNHICAQIYFTNDVTSLHFRARYSQASWAGWKKITFS